MDRRSWLWRRKSSEKSPSGETESSGSVSSHSERFSDDQTVSNHNTQSPEVTSKASAGHELSDSEKSLSEKLSEALLNIRAKEDLVKQHAKVAEEAVSGWERAENEVLVLKKQNDSLTEKNSILEERVGHLDGALKECLRELRQAREEQQDKIYEAISKKSSQWESKKSDRENQLLEFQSKLEAAEKENSILKLELDFSTHAAETASKQHLDSIRKVAKLEAECRKLKAVARKASSVYVESCTDSQSDNLESESCKLELVDSERILGRSLIAPSVEIDLMDDFLEMERIASLPETKQVDGGETRLQDELKVMINRTTELEENLRKVTLEKESLEIALCEETHLRDELESMINRTTELEKNLMKVTAEKENLVIALSCGEARTVELEENLRKITAENESLEIALNKCQIQLKASEDKLEKTEKELESTKIKLTDLSELLHEAEVNLVEIQDQLTEANEAKSIFQLQLNDANLKKAEAESKLKVMELELETLQSRIRNLEKEFEKERNFSKETVAKSKVLESEISKMKSDSQFRRSTIVEEFRINQDKELAIAADKFAECQKTIASLDRQLKSLATLDDFLIESEFS